jgi:tRNA(fMet)-specific endonuclease VapC
MAIILDADVIIRGEKGTFDLHGWLDSLQLEEVRLAAITVAELWHGVERATSKHVTARERYMRTIIGLLPVLPYTEQTAFVHARLWAELQSAGKMIGFYDVIVAATAIEHHCPVATFNSRHFANVPGLKVIEPKL